MIALPYCHIKYLQCFKIKIRSRSHIQRLRGIRQSSKVCVPLNIWAGACQFWAAMFFGATHCLTEYFDFTQEVSWALIRLTTERGDVPVKLTYKITLRLNCQITESLIENEWEASSWPSCGAVQLSEANCNTHSTAVTCSNLHPPASSYDIFRPLRLIPKNQWQCQWKKAVCLVEKNDQEPGSHDFTWTY